MGEAGQTNCPVIGSRQAVAHVRTMKYLRIEFIMYNEYIDAHAIPTRGMVFEMVNLCDLIFWIVLLGSRERSSR